MRWILALAIVLLVGCGPNEVKQYLVLCSECCGGDDTACDDIEFRGWQLPECGGYDDK